MPRKPTKKPTYDRAARALMKSLVAALAELRERAPFACSAFVMWLRHDWDGKSFDVDDALAVIAERVVHERDLAVKQAADGVVESAVTA